MLEDLSYLTHRDAQICLGLTKFPTEIRSPRKFRHPVSQGAHLDHVGEIMGSACFDFESEVVEFNADSNHIHPLVNISTKGIGIETGKRLERCLCVEAPSRLL